MTMSKGEGLRLIKASRPDIGEPPLVLRGRVEFSRHEQGWQVSICRGKTGSRNADTRGGGYAKVRPVPPLSRLLAIPEGHGRGCPDLIVKLSDGVTLVSAQ